MRRMNYLSVRILVLSAAGVISFLLFICLVMLLVGSEPLWLFILALALVLFLSLLGYYWVFLPYRRGER